MGKTVGVLDKDVHHLISQAYQAGGKYQWAREAAVNAIQADATWIRFGIEEQGYTNRGVARRYIADNGVGMNEEDLRIFLSSFGGGGRTIGMGRNFGQGFKSSCYEWNSFGIIVVSWTAETPDGRMIWIHREQKDVDTFWKLRDFQFGSGAQVDIADCIRPVYFDEIGIDVSELKTEEIEAAGHGTVFLFLGDSPERETMNGDYLRDETSRRGIVGFLNSRFIDVPEGVEVSVENFEASTGSDARRFFAKLGGGQQHYARRSVHGIRARISDGGLHRGTLFSKNGTRIHWYLTDHADLVASEVNGPKLPVIMVQYENEAYDVKRGARDYRLFGVPDEVRDRLWLIIEPPRLTEGSTGWGVTPQASRDRLIAKGERDLPWEDWYDTFYTKMPKEVRDAINQARSGEAIGDSESRRDRLRQVQAKFGARWRPPALVESVTGRSPGNRVADGNASGSGDGSHEKVTVSPSARPKTKDVGSGGEPVILDPNRAGEALGHERRKSEGIPEVKWEKFVEEENDEWCYAARFDPMVITHGSYGTVVMNVAWPLYQQQIQYWQGEYPRADGQEVEAMVKRMYEDEVVSKVMHATKLMNSVVAYDEDSKEVRLRREQFELLVSPPALTAAVVGLINVEGRIRTSAGSRFGSPASGRRGKRKKVRH